MENWSWVKWSSVLPKVGIQFSEIRITDLLISRNEIVLFSDGEWSAFDLENSLILRLIVDNVLDSLAVLLEVELVVDSAALQDDALSLVQTGVAQVLVLLLQVVNEEIDVCIQRDILH
jgi:hypothetical protein